MHAKLISRRKKNRKQAVAQDAPPSTSQSATATPVGPAKPALPGKARSAKHGQHTAPPEPVIEISTVSPPELPAPDPVLKSSVQPSRQGRPSPNPSDIRNLLNDLSGYLPGNGSASTLRVSKIIGIAEELKSMQNGENATSSAASNDPMAQHIGLLNALGRNLPVAGSSGLGIAGQMLSLVNNMNESNNSSGFGGLGNMVQMMSGLQPQSKKEAHVEKYAPPSQSEEVNNTINKLLSGLDEKQKAELMDKAKGRARSHSQS